MYNVSLLCHCELQRSNPVSVKLDCRVGRRPPRNDGFSLVELSIVLVILGLLTGGILTGQSLIRTSELRAVTTEYQRYVAATQTFRDKYFAIPGDFRDATRFWGRLNSNADCVTNSSAGVATPGACDGNGGGTVLPAGGASQAGELHQFWRHLALAGLIEGTYSGISGAAGANQGIIGTNLPRSKLSNVGWATLSDASMPGSTLLYDYDYGNTLTIGTQDATVWPYQPAFKPEEAWNIDTKIDDGRPGAGTVIAVFWNNACANSTSNTDYTGTYRLTDTSLQCSLIFARAF
jgi:prepilin-type N-terminal cleavage/methylation domain-containing protein